MHLDPAPITTVIIMARGLGSRMRKQGPELTAEQARAAGRGVKAMIDVGRPFLDHVISAAADAGLTDVILVIGPEHDEIRSYYTAVPTTRVTVTFAIQQEPRGTGDAVLAARDAVGGRRFILLNSDNHYPAAVLARLREVPGNGLVGFDPECLVTEGNIEAERVAAFALLEVVDGRLSTINEKPDPATIERLGARAPVSMNCFAFTPAVFEHAAALSPSPRGEYEITDAVRALVASGEEVTVVPACAGVLDLSSRGDVAGVAARLRDRPVTL